MTKRTIEQDARGQRTTEQSTTARIMSADPHPGLGGALGMGYYVGSAIAIGTMLVMMAVGAATRGLSWGELLYLSYLLAFLAMGILQQVWFNWETTMRLAYPGRVAGFGLTYFAVLVGCAWLGGWVPKDNPWAWVTFTAIYLVILAALTVAIGRALRRQGVDYQQRLDEYRASRR